MINPSLQFRIKLRLLSNSLLILTALKPVQLSLHSVHEVVRRMLPKEINQSSGQKALICDLRV